MSHCRAITLSLLTAALVTGCNNSSPSNNQTVTLTGTLTQQGVNSHEFTTSRNGEYSIRVTSLAPVQSALIGIYLGTPGGGICNQFGSITSAGLNTPAMSGGLNRGSYCLGIVDTGTLTAATTYSIQLSYP